MRRACEAHDRARGDEDAREHEDRRLGECGKVLGLAVAVGMRGVGGARRDADGEEGQERGD